MLPSCCVALTFMSIYIDIKKDNIWDLHIVMVIFFQ